MSAKGSLYLLVFTSAAIGTIIANLVLTAAATITNKMKTNAP